MDGAESTEPAEVAVSVAAAVEKLRTLAAVMFEADAEAGLFETTTSLQRTS